MSRQNKTSRRDFLGRVVKAGAASSLAAAQLAGCAAEKSRPPKNPAIFTSKLAELPARVFVQNDGDSLQAAEHRGSRFFGPNISIELFPTSDGTAVGVVCDSGGISRVVLRWEKKFPDDTQFLGDHWERAYGDLQWRGLQPERIMPWYFAAHHAGSGGTFMAGVKTQPATFCFWMVDDAGISLWLDFRNGSSPCQPGNREIAAATIVSLVSGVEETPMAALKGFCQVLCPNPRLAPEPICGNNNWYYAYGRGFDADAIKRDATFLAEIADGHPVRPYCVIDAGWTPGSVCPGGPWRAGDALRFPDMAALATGLKRFGVRPGIWMRPTALTKVSEPGRLLARPSDASEKAIDLTLPENLSLVREDVSRIRSWGYDLIKHDFSTFDIFGRWGFEMRAELTAGNWHFHDRTLTNAEIILRHYRILRESAGDAVLLGCNTIGHFAAGLFEIQRTGDDTSGKIWERTRRMGINALAFRLPQNHTFFMCDADCAAHTAQTPWDLDRQFLDLTARSGSALFISADPRLVQPEQKKVYRAAMRTALSGGASGGGEPLDWLRTTSPRTWRLGKETVTFNWEEPFGTNPSGV